MGDKQWLGKQRIITREGYGGVKIKGTGGIEAYGGHKKQVWWD